MWFRPHSMWEGLPESLEKAIEVKDNTELFQRFREDGFLGNFKDEEILFDPDGEDKRIGWKNCQLVSKKGWGVIGYTGEVESKRAAEDHWKAFCKKHFNVK